MEKISTHFIYSTLKWVSAYVLALCLGFLALVSCTPKSANALEGIPFLSQEEGAWGIIMLDNPDKPLFSEEFDGIPSPVYDGRFSVKDKDGFCRFYKAKAKPTQIGVAYSEVGVFQYGVAPVVRKGEHIEIIDRDGKVVKVLDRVDGNRVETCGSFYGGLAPYTTTKGVIGYIDTRGNSVIAAKYCLASTFAGGRAFVLDAKYKDALDDKKTDWSKIPIEVINDKGHVLHSFKGLIRSAFEFVILEIGQQYVRDGVCSGKYVVWGEADKPGIYGNDGRVIIKPQGRYKEISQVTDEGFVYRGESGLLGYCSLKGEQLIREKYMELKWIGPKRLIARNGKKEVEQLLDNEGVVLAEYEDLTNIPGCKLLIAKDGESNILVDQNGKKQGHIKVHRVLTDVPPSRITDQHVSADMLLEELKMTKQGLLGVTLDSKPMQVAQAFNGRTAEDVYNDNEEHNFISCKKRIGRLKVNILAFFQGPAVEAQVERTRNLQEWSIIDGQIDRCKFTSASLRALDITIDTENLEQAAKLFESFSPYLKRWGILIVSNTQGLVTEERAVYYVLAYGEKGCSVTLIRKNPGFPIENFLEGVIVSRGGEIKPRGYQNETDSNVIVVEPVVIPIS